MGSALSTFNDFQKTTGPSIYTSADKVVNEAVKQKYLLRRFLRGKDTATIIQGGQKIKDQLIFDESNTFTFTHPAETNTWQNPQVVEEWEIDWRYALDHMSWTAQEIELNITPGMTRTARHHQYKRLKRIKEQRMWTSVLNGMENQLFAVPETANMEASGGKQPYSIPAMVNEEADGLFYSTATVTGKTAWTTKQGIDPTSESRWTPQTETYSTTAVSQGSNNVIAAFDKMFYSVGFETPPTKQEYFENASLNAQFIACSKTGITVYQRLLRDYQDQFVTVSRQDPAFTRPSYAGIDLHYVTTLDTAKLYEAETATDALVTEGAGAGTGEQNGPRYYWLNANYANIVFHTTRYMFLHDPKDHPNQHNTFVQPCDIWYNLAFRSLQRQGIVSPADATDVYDNDGVDITA